MPSNPAQYSVPGMGETNVLGAYGDAYKGQLGAYNSAVASDNANMEAGAGIASAIISILPYLTAGSDRRLKTDIVPLGRTSPRGYPLYRYNLLGFIPTEGVMADEVQARDPSAVVTLASGFLAVDYSKV